MVFNYFNDPEGELEPRPPDRNRAKSTERDTGEPENEDEEPRSFASAGEVIDALEEAFRNDKNLFIKLCGKTLSWIKYYFFSNMLNDLTAEDVVNEAIKLIVTEKRKWYPDKTPNIINLLLMVIVSFIRNELKRKNPDFIGLDIYDKDGELSENDIVDLQRAYLRKDMDNLQFVDGLEDLIGKLYIELENDVYAYHVLDELLKLDHDSIKKPESFIAQELKITEQEVKNAIRRIRRKINRIIKKD